MRRAKATHKTTKRKLHKPTHFLRIKMDLVVLFKQEFDSIPMGGPKDVRLLKAALNKALRKVKGARGVLGGTWAFGVDRRKKGPGRPG